MALSTRELYLVLRAKNEAGRAFDTLSKDMRRAQDAASLMGAQSSKAHQQMELATLRNAKAQQEFAGRQLEAQKAAAQANVANEKAYQQQLAYGQATMQTERSVQQATLAQQKHKQAMDQNAIALMQNAQAHNKLQMEQLRGVQGSGQQLQALRSTNMALQDQINTVRDSIIARQNDINATRAQINATQGQINQAQVMRQNNQAVIMAGEEHVRNLGQQVQASREVVSAQRNEIANRELMLKQTSREIADIKEANKARGEAAQRMKDVGSAMTNAGTGMTIASGVALTGIYQLTQAAVDYEKQTAMTKTQVRETGVTLEQLGKIGLDVARDFGVSFDDIQKAFFDIFSSTDATVAQATTLLREFSKAAVAGSTDITTAGTTTIGVLNAWHRPLEDTTKILDTQFKTVQLGRITYEQLNSTIGRSIPSAVRAGQTFEELSGMIAYMTRSNMTGAQAVTSAGRALDLFSNPTVVGRLKEMGINARDAAGNFVPLSDVVVQLQQKMGKLDPAKRAEEINALFKGSGNNIQARRFWDLVLASEEGAKSFKTMVTNVSNSSGSLEAAYGTMGDTLAVRNEKMLNQWKVLKVELGEQLFPVLEKLINGLSKLADWFNALDPEQKKFAAQAAVIASVLTGVAGIVLVFGGALTVAAGVLGITAGALGLVVVAAGAFIAAWVYAYMKVEWFHDAVNGYVKGIVAVFGWLKDAAVAVWDAIVNLLQAAWRDIQTIWDALKAAGRALGDSWDWIKDKASAVWDAIKSAVSAAGEFLKGIWEGVKSALRTLGDAFQWLLDLVRPIWNALKLAADIWWAAMQVMWGLVQIAVKALGAAFDAFGQLVSKVWNAIKEAISARWNEIQALWNAMIAFIKGQFAQAWDWLSDKISKIWTAIKDFITGIWNGIKRDILDPIINYLKGPLGAAWDALNDKISAVWNKIKDASSVAWNWIRDNIFKPIQTFATQSIPDGFAAMGRAVESAWNKIRDTARAPIKFVVETILNNGLLAAYNKIAGAFNVKPDNVHVALPFASGGPVWGPGGPTSDLIPAMLSNGEHVLTAREVQNMGGHEAVEQWRAQARSHQALLAKGGRIGAGRAFAGVGSDVTMAKGGPRGGPLDMIGDLVKAGFDMLNPSSMLEKFKDMGGAGAGGFAEAAKGAGGKVVQGVIDWVKSKVAAVIPGGGDAALGGPSGNSIGRILQWARMFNGGAMVSSGYRPGDPGYHGAGLAADLIGGGVPGMQQIAAGFYGMSGRLLELIHSNGPGYYVKNGARVAGSYYASELAGHHDHVHVAAQNNALMDRGGILRPGMTNVMNGTGGAERVLSMAQTQSFDQLVKVLDGGSRYNSSSLAPSGGYGRRGGGQIVVNVYTNEIDPRRHAMMLGTELSNQIG